MIGANPFFKRISESDKVREAIMADSKLKNEQRLNITAPKFTPGMSFGDMMRGSVRVDAHPRFGFKTMLSGSTVPLPTAPAVVGGNVDWTAARATPVTHKLYDTLLTKRPMGSPPALGSFLRLNEPQQQSIHTTL
jgi:hypothetical protein